MDIKNIDTFNKKINHDLISLFIEKDGFLHKGLLNENDNFILFIDKIPYEKRIVSMRNGHLKEMSFQVAISKLENKTDYLVTLSDITILKEALSKTEKKASTDALTQVYNRRKFDEMFEAEFQIVKKNNGALSIALIDIDKFKDFNDSYGHLIGDEVLITMAQSVEKSVRDTDTFARWGGEEFVVLYKDTDIKTATNISLKLKDIIEKNVHPVAGKITASFGVTQYKKGDTIQSIFQRCDQALYLAKENGRNRVEVRLTLLNNI
jgi:diguanylate cyclase (GGDEF)-like protein